MQRGLRNLFLEGATGPKARGLKRQFLDQILAGKWHMNHIVQKIVLLIKNSQCFI